ncbi:D123-domain-containing protein [Ramaria rubella]|nr:D123-domain-containing protein [Ramaria rubella]
MPHTLFPCLSRVHIEQCQFSSWYTDFSNVSPKATIIRPLSCDFRAYLEEDMVIVPEGSENFPASSSLSEESLSGDEGSENSQPIRYAFPQLDAQIRDAITRYQAIFPKLNWTAPKDASWVIPTLKCTSPADVYLLLKSSDFVSHDIDPNLAFEGCTEEERHIPVHELELVLKKWYLVDRGREFRCFVRDDLLIAISQRDPNYYPHLNEQTTQDRIIHSVSQFWLQHIKGKFKGGSDYIFDVHLTRDLSSAHILDFNPYHAKTDSLLFAYNELFQFSVSATTAAHHLSHAPPVLRTITSASHPDVSKNTPANQHNAVPFEALQMSAGRDIATFSRVWEEQLKKALDDDDDNDSENETKS